MYERISSETKPDGTKRIVLRGPADGLFAKAHAVPMPLSFDRIGFWITVALCTAEGTALPHKNDDKGIAKNEVYEFYAAADGDVPIEERPVRLKADFDAAIDLRVSSLFAAVANQAAVAAL